MERELVGTCLALALGGSATVLAASWASGWGIRPAGSRGEVSSARRLWAPLLPAALASAFVLGWALQEPDPSDERVGPAWIAAGAVFGTVLVRAALRAVWSAASRRAGPAATVGFIRPRIVVSPALRARLDPHALAAAVAHEAAHARHRDPLRLLVGQLTADLQWPLPGARLRLAEWREALELARDDEARRAGVRGEDLAQAILTAAGLHRATAGAALTGAEEGARLRRRIERLLAPGDPPREEPRRWSWALLVPALVGVGALGVMVGDGLMSRLPGVGK